MKWFDRAMLLGLVLAVVGVGSLVFDLHDPVPVEKHTATVTRILAPDRFEVEWKGTREPVVGHWMLVRDTKVGDPIYLERKRTRLWGMALPLTAEVTP